MAVNDPVKVKAANIVSSDIVSFDAGLDYTTIQIVREL